MGDIKLFKTTSGTVSQIQGQAVGVEKTLQNLLEKNLFTFLGVQFLGSEYQTGKAHAGRIDTLGIDENNCPVIIEYKRAINENVINQGLYYLDWLLDHKGEFTLLVMKKLGKEVADDIEWDGARLLCIASDFTKFDEYSIKQINRNIELIRYRRFGDELLLLDLASSTTGETVKEPEERAATRNEKTVEDRLEKAPEELKNLYETLRAYLMALGDDVSQNTVKLYFAFKRMKNFACVDIHTSPAKLIVWVNLDPATVDMKPGFTRDVSDIGHHGTGDVEITIASTTDFEKAQPLLAKSYELN